MYQLFRLLFQNNYWRMLTGRNTWSRARMSMRRAHKDGRARKYLLAVALLLLLPVLAIVYLMFVIGSGTIVFVPFVIPVLWWIQRSNKKEDQATLSIGPATRSKQVPNAALDERALREYLCKLGLAYAVFVDRALSESYLSRNGLPEGHEAVARRTHMEVLKRAGVWECLAQKDRDVLIDADGKWEWQRIHQMALGIEPLLVIRWILRIDFHLPLIAHPFEVDSKLAREIIQNPEMLAKSTKLIDTAEMEIVREASRVFEARCAAELISRGHIKANDEATLKWADNASSALSGKQSEDLLIDGHIVSEVDEDKIGWAMALAHQRAEFLESAISLLEGKTAIGESLSAIS